MKWLEKNPMGVGLAATGGVLLLVVTALAVVWSRPVSSVGDASDATVNASAPNRALENDLGPLSAYRIVTERPVFDESRRPAVTLAEDSLDASSEDQAGIADAPNVKLTGVVLTPEYKMATLKPESGGETLIAHEGVPLEGEYQGWIVSDIKPRHVVLASLDGESMELDLQVNQRKIAEPPKPEPAPEVAAAATTNGAAAEQGQGEAEKPLTRAEEIRQRIAERREELRRQAAENEANGESTGANQRSQYQSAIRNMIKRKNTDENDNDQDDSNGDGGNGN